MEQREGIESEEAGIGRTLETHSILPRRNRGQSLCRLRSYSNPVLENLCGNRIFRAEDRQIEIFLSLPTNPIKIPKRRLVGPARLSFPRSIEKQNLGEE